MSLSVLVHVTHLLGAGHLTRAAALASACASRGHEVSLISGGMPNALAGREGIELAQLPPVKIEGTAFTHLLTPEGNPADGAYLARRRQAVLTEVKRHKPDVLITELFPFGRRILKEEFLAAVEAVRAQGKPTTVLSSIRDILAAPSRPERVHETLDRIRTHYDAVLVHGDPSMVPLEASWPVDEALSPFLHYTGYIDNPPTRPVPGGGDAATDVIVSGGFGAASLPLYRSSLEAANRSGRLWRILVGNGIAEKDFKDIVAGSPQNAIVERARPDFRSLLSRSSLSISQCGYNTAIDVLGLPLRRLFVPFEAGSETEQLLRAETLAMRGLAIVLRERDLSPGALAAAVENLLRADAPECPAINLDGAVKSALLIERLHGEHLQ